MSAYFLRVSSISHKLSIHWAGFRKLCEHQTTHSSQKRQSRHHTIKVTITTNINYTSYSRKASSALTCLSCCCSQKMLTSKIVFNLFNQEVFPLPSKISVQVLCTFYNQVFIFCYWVEFLLHFWCYLLLTYMICNYFLPINRLPFYFVNYLFCSAETF